MCESVNIFISGKTFPILKTNIGVHGAFLIYAFACLVVTFISFLSMSDTDGMSLEEIEKMYRSKKIEK